MSAILDLRGRMVLDSRGRPTVEAEVLETPRGPVISPKEPMPPLTDDLVFETLDAVRR